MGERLTQVTIVKKEVHKLLPGEATFEQAGHAWYIGCPGGHDGAGSLGGHTVVSDEAMERISVSPSILCYYCGAHYFVTDNQIRWC